MNEGEKKSGREIYAGEQEEKVERTIFAISTEQQRQQPK